MHTNHPIVDFEAVVVDDAQFVDVRNPDEVATGTLPGAVNIPLSELPSRIGELEMKRRVVVMCRTGVRSSNAAEILTDAGFVDVINLDGGMNGWNKSQRTAKSGGWFRSLRKGVTS